MKKVTVSAPGKLLLFGEHAVVYGRPCIVTAVDQRLSVTVELIDKSIFQLNAPDVNIINYQKPIDQLGKGNIPKGAKFVEIAVKNFLLSLRGGSKATDVAIYIKSRFPRSAFGGPRNDGLGVKVTTKSEFSSQFGFGSSSASTVCVIKALSELFGKKLSNKQIFDLSYKTILDVQGKGSGFDVAAATFGGTLYFVTGGKAIKPLNIPSLPLIVGYSGIKADTVTIVNQVLEKAKKYPFIADSTYTAIGYLVIQARKAIIESDLKTSGELMNLNQGYLEVLGVSSNKLSNMIYASRDAGAYGAKLSGAGIGDCMIALAPFSKIKAVKNAITKAGGQVINIKASVEGVKIE